MLLQQDHIIFFFLQKLTPDIPEYPTLNVKLQSFDYVLLDSFAKHVHKLARYFELESEW